MHIYIYIYIYIYIFFFFQQFNYIHLKKSLYSKRCDLNKVILRAVSYIVFIRCRLIYIHIHTYIFLIIAIYIYIYIYS